METEVFWPHLKVVWLMQRRFYRTQQKEKGEKVDGRRGGKTILRRGQGWTLLSQLGQLKTRLGGKGLFSHLWCTNDFAGLWERLD